MRKESQTGFSLPQASNSCHTMLKVTALVLEDLGSNPGPCFFLSLCLWALFLLSESQLSTETRISTMAQELPGRDTQELRSTAECSCVASDWVWHCRLVSLDLAPSCHRAVNRLVPGSVLWAAVWPWANVDMPCLPHMKNKVSTSHCRDTVMDGRGFTLPGLLKLSSSPLLGSQHWGQTSGRALARMALHVPPARRADLGWNTQAALLQHSKMMDAPSLGRPARLGAPGSPLKLLRGGDQLGNLTHIFI